MFHSTILKSSGAVPEVRFREPTYPIWEANFFLFEVEIPGSRQVHPAKHGTVNGEIRESRYGSYTYQMGRSDFVTISISNLKILMSLEMLSEYRLRSGFGPYW